MDNFGEPFILALQLLWGFDQELYEVIFLSLKVSCSAVFLALLLGIPTGALLATKRFFGRQFVILISKTALSMPPVVIGLIVYILISHSGPLGFLDILYTPAAMILAQFLLVLPISIALSNQIFEDLNNKFKLFFRSLGLNFWQQTTAFLAEAKYHLLTIMIFCFGRAISEIGAVILVGGNIRHLTRVMTTSIALETSKGYIAIALALGIVLIIIALIINSISHLVSHKLLRENKHVL